MQTGYLSETRMKLRSCRLLSLTRLLQTQIRNPQSPICNQWSSFLASSGVDPCDVPFRYAPEPTPFDWPHHPSAEMYQDSHSSTTPIVCRRFPKTQLRFK